MAARLREGFALWLLALVMSVAAVAMALWNIHDAEQAQAWPTAEGRIISSELKRACGKHEQDSLPQIVYEYRARGLAFRGDRVAMDTDFCGWTRAAMEVVQAYRPGQAVTVYYDPRAPHRSVLRQGAPQPRTIWALLACAAVATWSGVMLIGKLRSRKRRAR